MLFVYISIIGGVFIIDFFIKNKIEKEETEGKIREILGGRLLLRRHHNRGAAFNKGESRQPVVAAVSLGLAVFCTLLFLVSLGRRGSVMLRMGLALLLGGAYSNTYDRLKRKYVVDYVSFGVKWKWLRSIIFNISDFCIIIGAAVSAVEMSR